ncbi:MAG: serine hydrolase domain-containing protein, partial [Bacteroidota bacterium]
MYYFLFFNDEKSEDQIKTPFLSSNSVWVDSLIQNMSIEQKIGSLVFYDVRHIDSTKIKLLNILIKKYHIGGVFCEFDSSAMYIDWLNNYQLQLEIPLFIGLKTENSYPGYFNDFLKFPELSEINSVTDTSLLNKYSDYCANLNKQLGINISFMYPRFNCNNEQNRKNHIIRHQNLNILSGAIIDLNKDFPDSIELDKINKDLTNLFDAGISSLFIKNDILMDSLSNINLSNYINEQLNFKGLIFSSYNHPNEFTAKFIAQKIDALVVDKKVVDYINSIKELIASNQLTINELNERVKKILMAKSWTGLQRTAKIEKDTVIYFENSIYPKKINRLLINSSVVLVRNRGNFIPVKQINDHYFVYNIGRDYPDFNRQFNFYVPLSGANLSADSSGFKKIVFNNKSQTYIFNLNSDDYCDSLLNYFNSIISKNKNEFNCIVINYGNSDKQYLLKDCPVVIQIFNNTKTHQELAAQAIFGGISIKGKLPNVLNLPDYKHLKTDKTRLGYTIAEEFGLSSDTLKNIDSIAIEGLNAHAYPGCQIFVAKDGKVIYHKCFGVHSYDGNERVKWDDLYDIASVTKIAATTLATMRMYDQGKLKLDEKIEKYFKNIEIE